MNRYLERYQSLPLQIHDPLLGEDILQRFERGVLLHIGWLCPSEACILTFDRTRMFTTQ